MSKFIKGQTVRNAVIGMVGTFVRMGDPNCPTQKGAAWIRFEKHGLFCQRLEDLEAA